MMHDCIEKNNLEAFTLLLRLQVFTAGNIDSMLDLANTGKNAEIMMSLLSYKQDHFGMTDRAFEL
jgi:hypothetical protein